MPLRSCYVRAGGELVRVFLAGTPLPLARLPFPSSLSSFPFISTPPPPLALCQTTPSYPAMSSGAPPPNMAEIPLPPGMTLDQFQNLQAHLSEYRTSHSGPEGLTLNYSQNCYHCIGRFRCHCVGLVRNIPVPRSSNLIICAISFIQLPSEIALYKSKDKNIWKAPATWWSVISCRYREKEHL